MSRDDAVVRLQGRRKEEPRREPVPVTGPPAGRRTRHTAPYRPLLSHSLPSPRYALRPSRPVCYLLANLTSRAPRNRRDSRCLRVLQTMSTRGHTAALIMLPPAAFTARELYAVLCPPTLPPLTHLSCPSIRENCHRAGRRDASFRVPTFADREHGHSRFERTRDDRGLGVQRHEV